MIPSVHPRYTQEMTTHEAAARGLKDAEQNIVRGFKNLRGCLINEMFNPDHPVQWINSRHQERKLARTAAGFGATYDLEVARRAHENAFIELTQADPASLQNDEYREIEEENSNEATSIEAGEANHVFKASETKLDILKTTLAKDENGYPALKLDHALDSLHKKGLKPTLLLIDEVGEDRNDFDKQITKNQLALIDKVKKLGGQVLICTRPSQPDLKPELKSAVASVLHTFCSIRPLNKLENPELRDQVCAADFVIVAGFDTNECVRNTVGVQEDFQDYYEDMTPGLVQAGIPVLFSDDCARGTRSNKWEGSRFEDALFFWGREDSPYRLADQAVREYRAESGDKLADLKTKPDPDILRTLQSNISEINGLSNDDIKGWIRHYNISPDNPLLDRITRPSDKN
jgi:hypothetical protein